MNGGPSFGQLLRSLRESAGLSQDELAQRARMSAAAISALERGARRHPYPATIRALVTALELSPEQRARLSSAVPKRSGSPAARRHGSSSSRLPVPSTALIGREQDVGEISHLLTSLSVRLITLTGIGGIGKTRLALAAAETCSPAMPDGVAFVPLAAVDQALVWPELGRALGVNTASGDASPADILAVAAELEMLLVLDNCEHLPGLGEVVASLLEASPSLTVLATSRAPLRLRAEHEYLVQPLPLPPLGTTDLSALEGSPAAVLFLERGRAVRRDLTVRPADTPAIADICHRLAGLPLALELAAAGLRTLDPAALRDHLGDVLAGGGPADLPARQRTMRATMDWSYGLQSEKDQRVLRRLAVFVGGFTLAAAESVADDTHLLGAIDRLTAHSLCLASDVQGGVRYGMLEPVAQYARSLLAESDESSARLAHAEYFVVLAERAEQALHRSDLIEALQLFDTEESNLWSALDWAAQAGQADLAGRLTWALFMFWWIRGRRERGRLLVERVLSLELSDRLRARVVHAAAALSEPGAESAEAVERLYLRSVTLAQGCGDHLTVAASAIGAGLIALERGDLETAEPRLRAGLSASLLAGDPGQWTTGLGHSWLATARRFQGDAPSAVRHATEALLLTRRRGDTLSECIALYNLAHAEILLTHHDQARSHLVDAVLLCQQTRDAGNLSFVLDTLATVEFATGAKERVATLLGAAETLRQSVRSAVYRWYAPDIELRQRTSDAVRAQLGEEAYARAVDAGHAFTFEGAIEFAQRSIPSSG